MIVNTLSNFNKTNNEHKQKLRHMALEEKLEDTNVVIIKEITILVTITYHNC
jgi:hypothetical protein